MEERISLEDLQENIDEIFDRVEDGESFIITMDDKDVAILMPYTEENV